MGWSLAARSVPCSGCSSSGLVQSDRQATATETVGDRARNTIGRGPSRTTSRGRVGASLGVRLLASPWRKLAGAPPRIRRCHRPRIDTDAPIGRECAWSSPVTVGVRKARAADGTDDDAKHRRLATPPLEAHTLKSCLKKLTKEGLITYGGRRNCGGRIGFTAEAIPRNVVLRGNKTRLAKKLHQINAAALLFAEPLGSFETPRASRDGEDHRLDHPMDHRLDHPMDHPIDPPLCSSSKKDSTTTRGHP